MKLRPNKDLRKRILDKASLWIIGIAVFVAVIGFALFGNQLRQSNQQNATIIQQNSTIISLLRQHSSDLALQKRQSAQFAAAEKLVVRDAGYIRGVLQWEVNIVAPLCEVSVTHSCPAPPVPPS